ncbi:MAG TPA: DUF333 domain-containing protein [Chloroflexi bacterium]|nr:DUF333 domain-containing protein [Chloroflexota bacterium]
MKYPGRMIITIIFTAVSLFTLSGCSLVGGKTTPTPYPNDGEEDPFIGVPNPASFYCQEMGYELEMRETDQGTEGICIFPNGAECEEWEFLAGGCSIEWSFCQRQGYNIRAGEGMAICTFNDGSTCPEYDFFIGKCQPPQD